MVEKGTCHTRAWLQQQLGAGTNCQKAHRILVTTKRESLQLREHWSESLRATNLLPVVPASLYRCEGTTDSLNQEDTFR